MSSEIIEDINTRSEWIKAMIDVDKIVSKRIVKGTAYLSLKEGNKIYAVVIAFRKNKYGLSGSIMDESMNPYYYDCPSVVFNTLTYTADSYALAWRQNVRKQLKDVD